MDRYEHCTHPNQKWCDCDWCRLVREHDKQHGCYRCDAGKTMRYLTLRISAAQYADHDDCLSAAAADIAAERNLAGYDLSPRWEGGDEGERDIILIDIPEWAA